MKTRTHKKNYHQHLEETAMDLKMQVADHPGDTLVMWGKHGELHLPGIN